MRNIKFRVIFGFAIFLLFMFFSTGVYPLEIKQQIVKLYVAGKEIALDGWCDEKREIFLVSADGSSTLEMARAMGGDISYDKRNKIVVITKDVNVAKIFMDSFQYEWREKKQDLPYPPQFFDGKPYIPFQVFPEILGGKVIYDEEKQVYYFDPLITKIELKGTENRFYLDISATGPINAKNFIVRDPERCVVDIPDAILVVEEKEIQNEKIGKIYYNQNNIKPNLVRIVIPQDKGAEVEAQSRKILNHIVFTISIPESTSHVQNFSTQGVNEINVKEDADSVKIFVSSDGPFQYRWHRLKPPDNRFFVDIPLSILKLDKKEFLLKSDFIEKVKIAQFQLEPEPVVRVVLYLKAPVEVSCFPSEAAPNQLAMKITSGEIDPEEASYTGAGVTSFSAKGKVICLDAGHGGSDTGAINQRYGVFEKNITLDITMRLSKILVAEGWNVILTRRTDRDVTYPGSSAKEELGARAGLANDMKADIFMSIHTNAMWSPEYGGISTHWYKKKDYALAKAVQSALIDKLKRKNKGLRRDRFYVLRVANMPSVLLELLYVSNPAECKLLLDENFRQKIAEAIATGLRSYLVSIQKEGKNNE